MSSQADLEENGSPEEGLDGDSHGKHERRQVDRRVPYLFGAVAVFIIVAGFITYSGQA